MIIRILFGKWYLTEFISKVFYFELFWLFIHHLFNCGIFWFYALSYISNLYYTPNMWFKWKIAKILYKFLQIFTCFGVYWIQLYSIRLLYVFRIIFEPIWMVFTKRLVNSQIWHQMWFTTFITKTFNILYRQFYRRIHPKNGYFGISQKTTWFDHQFSRDTRKQGDFLVSLGLKEPLDSRGSHFHLEIELIYVYFFIFLGFSVYFFIGFG